MVMVPCHHHVSPSFVEWKKPRLYRPGFFYERSMSRVTSRLRFIEPQLASSVEEPPEGKHWFHEIKHDGYPCQVLLQQGHGRVFTRNGHDWTDRFPSFTELIFVVVGTDRDRKTGALRALLAHNDGLSYAGAAFIALAGEERARFFAEPERLTTSWGLFKASRRTDVKWCHPRLAVEVKHLAGSKTLRHATVTRIVP